MRHINTTLRRIATTVSFVLALTGLSRPALARPAGTEFTFVSLGIDGIAYGINDWGDIVGTFGVLVQGSVTPLDDVPGSRPGSTIGRGINDCRDIVGIYHTDSIPPNPFPKGFLYRDGVYARVNGREQAVEVFGINNDGYMVGRSCCARGGNPEGFIVDPSGGVQSINVPDSPWDWASSINASGQIVGTFRDRTTGAFAAYLYSNPGFTRFNVPGAGLTNANGINDAG
jgi:hypothetical protein